LNQPRI